MANADRSAEETPRAGPSRQPPKKPPRKPSQAPPSRSRSPVDDANVLLGSGEYDDETLDASSPRPGPSREVPARSPTPPRRQTPEERWEARQEQVHALYEELRQSNNIDELRAFIVERYFDAVRYDIVWDALKDIVVEYATEEQKQRAEEYNFHDMLMLNIIKDLLEACRNNRALLEIEFRDKYEDALFKSERERKRQILRGRYEKFQEAERNVREDEEHVREVAHLVYTTLMRGLQQSFIPRIRTLTPDPDQVHFAVEEWMRTTERILEERQAEVNSLIQKTEFMELRRHRQNAHIDRLGEEISDLKREEMERLREIHFLRQRLEDLENQIEEVNQEYHNRRFGRGIQQPVEEADASGASTPGASIFGTPGFQSTPMPRRTLTKRFKRAFTKPVKKIFGSPDTPGARRAHTSPEYYEDHSDEFGESYGIVDTPPGISPPSGRPSPFNQTFVLTSPRREEPLFVNIGVNPSNLIDTVQGERFVCDIQLDVQPGGQLLQLQHASGGVSSYETDMSPERSLEMSGSPIIKGRYMGRRNIPPDITPTSTRRHGLFTPRGIFKRGQLNIRRIPGKHPISELPWSPTYLPEDARSPVTSLASPLRWSDRSVSWERAYSSDLGSPSSFSPIITRPGYAYSYSSSSLPTSYRYQSPGSDGSSPLAVIQGPGYNYQAPYSDRSSPSPMVQGPDYRYQSTDSDRSSASPTFVERFGRYPSPIASPLFATPSSGYQPELEISADSGRVPYFARCQDPLNRRVQFGESSSYASQAPRVPERGLSPPSASYQDPFNRRMQLGEMIESSRHTQQTSDSMDSERGYVEDSPDSSLLNEARFL